MNLTEFASSRGVAHQTVSMYISRHPEFNEHISKDGRNTVLDDEAIRMLEEKYPLPQPVQVIPDAATKEENEKLKEKVILLQEELNGLLRERADNAELIASATAQQRYIEQQESIIADMKEDLLEEQGKVSVLQTEKATMKTAMEFQKNELELAQDGLKKAEEEKEQLRKELDQLRSRSFWQRLFGR